MQMGEFKDILFIPDEMKEVRIKDDKTGEMRAVRKKTADGKWISRRITAEIVDVFGFKNTSTESTCSMPGVRKSLLSMMRCAARAKTVAFNTMWLQSGAWKVQLREKDRAGVEKAQAESEKLFGDSAANILHHLCPCLPTSMTDAMGQELFSAFTHWNKDAMREKRRPMMFKPPTPLRVRGRSVRVTSDGRDVKIEIPLRRSELCPWAKEQTEKGKPPPCVHQEWVDKEKAKQQVTPVIGVEGKTAYVVLRAVGSRRRNHDTRTQEVLRYLLDGTYKFRDVCIRRQGSEGGKLSWMVDISYRMPEPEAAEGQTAIACFSHTYALYMVAEDGSTFHDEKTSPLLAKQAMFDKEREDAADRPSAAIQGIRDRKNDWVQRQKLAHASLGRVGVGSRGHGVARRYRDVALVQAKEKDWATWTAWDIARVADGWCREHHVAKILLIPWKDADAEDFPRHLRHLILRFPRSAIKEKLAQLSQKAGREQDDVAVKSLKKNKKSEDEKAEPLSKTTCPECGEILSWNIGGDAWCPTDGCGFKTGYDFWKCVMAMSDAGIPAGVKIIERSRQRNKMVLAITNGHKKTKAKEELKQEIKRLQRRIGQLEELQEENDAA